MAAQEVAQSVPDAFDDLYVMQMGRGGPIKIGRSSNVLERQRVAQSNCPYEVDTLFVIRGHGPLERAWHKAFEANRLRGEWFEFTPEVEEALASYRTGDDWWLHLFPPDDLICEATADFLGDGLEEPFEDAYAKCVRDWRWVIEYEIASATVEIEKLAA